MLYFLIDYISKIIVRYLTKSYVKLNLTLIFTEQSSMLQHSLLPCCVLVGARSNMENVSYLYMI